MNHYTRALAELKAQPAHKLSEVGDQWQTPPALYWGINALFGPFLIDLFTDGENSKCPRFYTAENNALLQDWAKDLAGGKAFANPPYSRSSYDDDKNAITGMRNIMAKVMFEREKGARIVLLLKSATSEVWWPEQADHVAFVRGRISFDLPAWFVPASDKDKSSAAGFAVAICVFDKEWRGQPMQYIERESLLAQGNAIISMIEQRASELAQQYASSTLEQRPDDAELGELSGNSGDLPEHELSTDALQLPDHIVDATEMVGTHINEGANVCASVTEEQAEQIATKCVEQSGTDTNDGTKALTIPTVAFTSEQIAEQLASGKLPFTGDHLALMLQLDGMFGKHSSYTTSQIRAAVLAFDEPGMVTKAGEVVAAVQPEATETTEEQSDLFEHFDEAMAAGTEPVPEPEAEPAPAAITSKTGKVKSDDAEVFFDQLQIPQNVRVISAKCPDTGISRSGYAIWAKGYFSAGKINGIGIRSTGDFKKGYFYEPTLVVFHQGKDVGEYTNWPEALAALDALLQPDPEAEPQGEAHPFFTGFYGGHATYAQTVPDKVAKVKTFTLEQCQAALKLPHLQSTVVAAVEARIRKLQKEQAAA